jgi:hypothetical protein
MRWSAGLVGVAALGIAACGGHCPEPRSPGAPAVSCGKGVPSGRWNGEWESSLLSNPDHKRSGNIDLSVSENGTMVGETIEHYNGYTGQLTGAVKAGGEFHGEYRISRDGSSHRYVVKGNFSCDSEGISGRGAVTWAGSNDRGSLSFDLQRAE